jgi:hypothetical protein
MVKTEDPAQVGDPQGPQDTYLLETHQNTRGKSLRILRFRLVLLDERYRSRIDLI